METNLKKRPVVFLFVGLFNALLDFGFYTLLASVILKNTDIAVIGLISGTFALISAFTTHSLVTWRGRSITTKTLLKFIVFTGLGMWALRPLLLSMFIVIKPVYVWLYSISQHINLPFTYDFVAQTGAFGFMIIILTIYNFLTYERFVFSEAKSTTTHTDQETH